MKCSWASIFFCDVSVRWLDHNSADSGWSSGSRHFFCEPCIDCQAFNLRAAVLFWLILGVARCSTSVQFFVVHQWDKVCKLGDWYSKIYRRRELLDLTKAGKLSEENYCIIQIAVASGTKEEMPSLVMTLLWSKSSTVLFRILSITRMGFLAG